MGNCWSYCGVRQIVMRWSQRICELVPSRCRAVAQVIVPVCLCVCCCPCLVGLLCCKGFCFFMRVVMFIELLAVVSVYESDDAPHTDSRDYNVTISDKEDDSDAFNSIRHRRTDAVEENNYLFFSNKLKSEPRDQLMSEEANRKSDPGYRLAKFRSTTTIYTPKGKEVHKNHQKLVVDLNQAVTDTGMLIMDNPYEPTAGRHCYCHIRCQIQLAILPTVGIVSTDDVLSRLFPLREPGTNSYAQPLHQHEIEKITQDSVTTERLLVSYKMMLGFYGIDLVDRHTGEVQRALNWQERFHNLNRNTHNNLRITRILKSLGLLGFRHFQLPLIKFFVREIIVEKTLYNCRQSCFKFWMSVLDYDAHQEVNAYVQKLEEYSIGMTDSITGMATVLVDEGHQQLSGDTRAVQVERPEEIMKQSQTEISDTEKLDEFSRPVRNNERNTRGKVQDSMPTHIPGTEEQQEKAIHISSSSHHQQESTGGDCDVQLETNDSDDTTVQRVADQLGTEEYRSEEYNTGSKETEHEQPKDQLTHHDPMRQPQSHDTLQEHDEYLPESQYNTDQIRQNITSDDQTAAHQPEDETVQQTGTDDETDRDLSTFTEHHVQSSVMSEESEQESTNAEANKSSDDDSDAKHNVPME